MRIEVVLNCKAGTLLRGTPEAAKQSVGETFAAFGLSPQITCADGKDIVALIHAASRSADLVVVGGGDGTLRSAAAILAESRATMGVLPLGTFNHFAKDLDVPLDLEGAVRVIAEGEPAPLDLASVNGRVFINHAAVGIYPHMVDRRERLRKSQGLGKFPAMAIAMVDTLREYPTFGLRIRIGDETRTRRSPFLFVANNRYILDAYGLEQHDGRKKLTLLLAHNTGRWGLFRMGLKAFAGRLGEDAYDTYIFERAVVESRRRRLLVELDGELDVMRPGGQDVGADRGELEGMERPAARAVG
jgi:diacylglycerol kinase family enzyme